MVHIQKCLGRRNVDPNDLQKICWTDVAFGNGDERFGAQHVFEKYDCYVPYSYCFICVLCVYVYAVFVIPAKN